MSIKNTVEIQRRTDLRKYKSVIARQQRSFIEVGTALGMIRVQQLYKDEGYATFETFVETECDMSRAHAYRLVDAARVVQILSPLETFANQIKNEAQARQLVPLGKDRDAMVAVLKTAEARGPITAQALATARTELFPEIKVIDGEIVGDRPELVEALRAEIESAEANQKKTAAGPASRPTDGGEDLAVLPPAAGPGPTDPSGEADRPGLAVNPTNLDDAVSGDVEAPPSPVQGGIGDGGQAERVESDDSPPAEPAEPEELTSPLSGEADPEQDGTGVTRPAPDPSDPAALLEWFAERWEHVDADVSGPLLTDDDVLLLEASLNRVVFTFELLIKWRDRAQP